MKKTFKYRLYPTKKQIESLTYQLNAHRFLYNQALAQRKETYEKFSKNVTCYDQINLLPKLRKENKNIACCNYSSLQQTLRRLDKSFKAFI